MAKRFYINKDLDLLEFQAESDWGYARHKHNFYELTFVLKGCGQHLLNDSIINYKEGDVFFLTPKDEHEFVIAKPTTFGIIKFTEQLFLDKTSFSESNYWQKSIESVIFHSNIIAESIIHYEKDKHQIFGLYNLIKWEINNPLVYNRNVLNELFGALLMVLSRNLKSTIKKKTSSVISNEEKIENILTYVRQNILDKDSIRIKTIAQQFYMSPNYVSVFIKKHAGISIQQYVINTKIKMAERLLKQTSLSLSEIAQKMNFTDSSHFTKTFKTHKKLTPKEFRDNG